MEHCQLLCIFLLSKDDPFYSESCGVLNTATKQQSKNRKEFVKIQSCLLQTDPIAKN